LPFKRRILAQGVTLVYVKPIPNDEFLYSDGILFEEKLEMVNYFPVLRLMGRKLLNFVNNFKLKHFNFKDLVYKKGDVPESVFFII
jgi:hypothetical protein